MSIQRPTTAPPTGVFPRVVVIGAGTGGLCLAQGLKRVGIPVAIYERDRTRTDGLPPDLYNNTRATSTGASPPPRAGFPQAS
jgi:cation diffusion facilitator CzcD-associated flavoprotein CzcO